MNIAAQMFEAEHIGLDDPGAGGHSIKPERAVLVGESDQASLALRGTHGGAGNRLATGLDSSRLCGNRLSKD